MHAKPDLRVVLKWMINRSGSVIADVIRVNQMAISFVVRTPYEVPNGRFIKRFRDDTVLDWLRRVWNTTHDSTALLGGSFYGGFAHLLDARHERSLPVPQTNKDVAEMLRENSYSTHIGVRAGNFEIETDDDEMYLCQYFFNSKFEERNQNRIKFITTETWLSTSTDSSLNSRPCTFVAARYPCQTSDSIYWDFWKLNGHRLNRIGEIVTRMNETRGYTDCQSLTDALDDFDRETSWRTAINKLSTSSRFANKSTVLKCSKHICQLNQHEQTWRESLVYCQLIVFDDLWAKTHPVMFRSLKRMRHGDILFGKQPRITM